MILEKIKDFLKRTLELFETESIDEIGYPDLLN